MEAAEAGKAHFGHELRASEGWPQSSAFPPVSKLLLQNLMLQAGKCQTLTEKIPGRDAFVLQLVLLIPPIPKLIQLQGKNPIFLIENRAMKTDINSIKHLQAALNYFKKKKKTSNQKTIIDM